MRITSPTKRRDQGLPLVTCHGFAPPTFLHQGLALRASVPAITEAIRPEAAGRLSWSCGWHDRRKRQGEPERSSTMTCGPSHPSVSHQAPYRTSRGRADCAFGPRSLSNSRELLKPASLRSRACRTGHQYGWQSRMAAEDRSRAYRGGWKGRAAGSDPGIKTPPLPS